MYTRNPIRIHSGTQTAIPAIKAHERRDDEARVSRTHVSLKPFVYYGSDRTKVIKYDKSRE